MHTRFCKITNGGHNPLLRCAEAKAGSCEKIFHVHVFGKQGALQPGNTFLAGDFYGALQKVAAQPAVLILVGNNKSYFGIIASAITNKPGDAGDMPGSASIRMFGNQGELAVIVNETLRDKPLVRNPGVQMQRREITQVDASF